MRVARLYVEAEVRAHSTLELPPQAAHHAARVLRLRKGDAMTLFDGRGGEYEARVVLITRDGMRVEVGAHDPVERESPLAVTLAQGISSGERMDLTVQKAVELGVASIHPLAAARSVVRLDAERARARLEHWRRIAISACEQCGRNRVPQILEPVTVHAFCAQADALPAARWLLSPAGAPRLREAAARVDAALALAVGPEGGFEAEEVARFERAGFVALNLGPRVLRTETAALAALAGLGAIAGDG